MIFFLKYMSSEVKTNIKCTFLKVENFQISFLKVYKINHLFVLNRQVK